MVTKYLLDRIFWTPLSQPLVSYMKTLNCMLLAELGGRGRGGNHDWKWLSKIPRKALEQGPYLSCLPNIVPGTYQKFDKLDIEQKWQPALSIYSTPGLRLMGHQGLPKISLLSRGSITQGWWAQAPEMLTQVYTPAVLPWVWHFFCLGLSGLICNIIVEATSRAFVKIKWTNTHEVFYSVAWI